MSIKKINIEIPKMDYQIIEISITENGIETKLSENDNIYFTVKKCAYDSEPTLQKSLNNGINYNKETKKYEIEIKSEDTENMEIDEVYGYDITVYYEGNRPKQKVVGNLKIGIKYTLNEVV